MKLFTKCKDGGPESPVDSYTIIELKGLFSIMFLKFSKGRREAFHTHAFNAYTWFLAGDLVEEDVDGSKYVYKQSLLPKLTIKEKNHRVRAIKDSWCFTVRGPWQDTWTETNKQTNTLTTFTHGRKVLSTESV